jgi:hypothetical protein
VSRALFAAILAFSAPAYAEARFFTAINDLPLPPGFIERDAGAVFESEGARIVFASAEGEMTALAARAFYTGALPQLGWALSPQSDDALVFQRGREQLIIAVEREGGQTRLSARLLIRPASMNAD